MVLTCSHLRATPFLKSLREDWLQFFQVELPKAEEPLVAEAAEIWERYMEEISHHIMATAPDIHPYFEVTSQTMSEIQVELCTKITASIKSISEGASQIHPLFVKSLRAGLAPYFKQTLRIKGKQPRSIPSPMPCDSPGIPFHFSSPPCTTPHQTLPIHPPEHCN
jgi:hypothetical protein